VLEAANHHNIVIDPASLFVLSEETFCATNPVYHQHKVPCCGSCQMRERRNQNKQGTQPSIPASSVTTSESNPPFTPSTHTTGYLSPVDFVCPEIIECKGGKAWIRMRITCYCSHHQETTGFWYVVVNTSKWLMAYIVKCSSNSQGSSRTDRRYHHYTSHNDQRRPQKDSS
jgi:hypothetical protein